MKKIVLFLILINFFILPAKTYSGWFEKGTKLFNSFKKPEQLSLNDIAKGLKEALRVGTGNVISQLGKTDGFNDDPYIHIPLPDNLRNVKKTLSKIGLEEEFDNLELKLNRAAEIATPKAKKIFFDVIMQMTMQDVKKIYKGKEDAATQYFKRKMELPLKNAMKPIIDNSLNSVKGIQIYNSILQKYNSIPFIKPIHGGISDYVLDKCLNGIFYYLAKEEAGIRKNPAKRTTEILKKVFGR